MAEFCLDCWNKINNSNDPPIKYILSKELELCEECGQWKRIIIVQRTVSYWYRFRVFLFPFVLISKFLYLLWRILLLPYLIYKDIKQNKT